MRWAPIVLLAGASFALQASPVKVPPKKKTATHHSSVTAAHSSRSTHRSSLSARHARPRPPAPTFQVHPDPERYVQIQQALADRGYFKGQVNGEWNDDSVDALRRFQADQKLPDDGKLSSLTLIGLGLGARHDGTTASSVPAPTADPTTATTEPPPPHFP